ncbi:triacylglycerol lipase [Rhodoferax sp. PAMC 29310]|uniref:esterase/lipase family protein n=1 Tax=Rhodoferax sp. PAMC 29310 TaxID=2822760 RepID=UPI001B31CFB4|nr:alpha/beta hydrolase [Rhodoferax sp. PAMC 29310]
MAKPPSKNPLKHLQPSDLRGIAQLATEATAGVTRIAEGVHQSVWRTLGAPSGATPNQTRGLTGLVYQSVQGVTQLVGKGVDAALAGVQSLLAKGNPDRPASPEREAVVAALNGVLGDRLVTSSNPLATAMSLRHQGLALDWQAMPPRTEVTGKVLILIHGLCMNDLQWQVPAGGSGSDHGAALAATLDYTPIYVRYNTGRHTSQSGHELAAQLEQLVMNWPVPLEELTVVAHSMGGLVTRSAIHSARQAGLRWPSTLKNIVFLGTPHHGAPLERAGNWVDVILGSTPYTAPFAKLGQLRSAGITDLRYGHVLDADWQGHDRFQRKPDSRQLLPLPEGIACFTLAATTAPQRGSLADRLIGDGLVPLHSALGQHDDPLRTLFFAKPNQSIAYRMNHLALLNHPTVTQQLLKWLTPEVKSD